MEQAAVQSTSAADFFGQLERQGHIVVQDSRQVTVEKTPETEALDKAATAARKEAEEEALTLLENGCTTAAYTALYHGSRNLEMQKQIEKAGYDVRVSEEAEQLQETHQKLFSDPAALAVFRNYLRLQARHIDPGQIVPLMREHRGARKLGDLLSRLDTYDRIRHYESLSPADRRDVDRILRHKEAIRAKVTESTSLHIKTCNRVTADTITAVVNSDRDAAIKLSKGEAMRLFHILFETDVAVVKENGKAVKYFGIVADKTSGLLPGKDAGWGRAA